MVSPSLSISLSFHLIGVERREVDLWKYILNYCYDISLSLSLSLSLFLQAYELDDLCDPGYDPEAHEAEPTGLAVGISIDDLTKIYNRRVSDWTTLKNIATEYSMGISRNIQGNIPPYNPPF